MHRAVITLLSACVLVLVIPSEARPVDRVIQISVDGLGATYLQALIAGNQTPNFQRLQQQGVWTHNARTDYDKTETLPNHITMVTARGVWEGDYNLSTTAGHGWSDNADPPPGVTIHSNRGDRYAASVFDVAHTAGRTAMYATKTKFSLFPTSYPGLIDTYEYNTSSATMTTNFISQMSGPNPYTYAFLHFYEPDSVGHSSGWGSTAYNNAVKTVDGYLGQIFNLIDTTPGLQGNTAIVLTADHGGQGGGHGTITGHINYDIPFYAWAPGVTGNTDLYSLNGTSRLDPVATRPDYSAALQPVRNGDGANLSLELLGLGAIAGSTINAAQDLNVFGTGTAGRQTIAYNAFNETPIGVTAWTPGGSNTELGFSTTVSEGPIGSTYSLGTYDSSSSPRRFRMRGYTATTTFDTVDLTGWYDIWASIDILIANTGYEADDYFYAKLTNGIDWITLADVQGLALNSLAKDVFLHYDVAIPAGWTQATLVIGSSTDSGSGSEIVNFDNIFLEGQQVPEPSALAVYALLGGVGVFAALRQRRKATRRGP